MAITAIASASVRTRIRNQINVDVPPVRVPAAIVITPSPFSVTEGGTTQLTATVYDQLGEEMAGQTVDWASSAAGVATVNSAGLVTGVAAGSATITASTTGAISSLPASCTVSPAAVASLDVTPASLVVAEGATQTLTYQPRDASGNALAGRTVTADSSDVGVATVSLSGYTATVTGVAAGSATITGHASGIDSAGVTATVNAPAAGYPNLPAGLSLIAHATCDVAEATIGDYPVGTVPGYTGKWAANGNLALVTDATAPLGRSTVTRCRWPSGSAAGNGTFNYGGWSNPTNTDEYDEVYVSYWWKLVGDGTDYECEPTQTKLFFVSSGLTSQDATNFLAIKGAGGGAMTTKTAWPVYFVQQGTAMVGTTINRNQNRNGYTAQTASWTVGTWIQTECYFRINANTNVVLNNGSYFEDGIFRCWMGGTLVMEYTNVCYRRSGATKRFKFQYLNAIVGGSVGVKSQTDDLHVTDIAVYAA